MTSNEKKWGKEMEGKMSSAIRLACQHRFGVLDSNFLCQSVSVLNPHPVIAVTENDTLEKVLNLFQERSIGSVAVVNEEGKLCGIFTERDVVRRVLGQFPKNKSLPIREFMTKDPVAQPPDITIAFALNLMSHGGFRHIPMVDQEGKPIGMVSVRDVVDYVAVSLMDDLMKFQTE